MKAKDLAAFFQAFPPEMEVLLDINHYLWDAERNNSWPLVLQRVVTAHGPVTARLIPVRNPDPACPSPYSHTAGVGSLPSIGEIRQEVLLEKVGDEKWARFHGRFREAWIRVDWFRSPGDPVNFTRMRKEGDQFVESGKSRDGFLPYFLVRDGYRPIGVDLTRSGISPSV